MIAIVKSKKIAVTAAAVALFAVLLITLTVTFAGTASASEANGPKAPLFAEYAIAGGGFGGGKLTVTLPEGHKAYEIQPYWAGADGILDGYTPLPKFKTNKKRVVSYNYPSAMIVPEAATELWIYTRDSSGRQSAYCYVLKLPEGSGFADPGTAPAEFQVISDIHITTNDAHIHNLHFGTVLDDIAKVSPSSFGLFINGDMADTGNETEYENMMKIYNARENVPPFFMAIGNHDLYNGTLEEKTALFLKYAKLPDGSHPDSSHYDFWLNGFHFVFLGNDNLVNGVDTTLNASTLEWLKKVLDSGRDKSRPIFLFIHQSLYDTVAGSLPGQNWNGVQNEEGFRELIYKYPEIIMFNGHSHWIMDSVRNICQREDHPVIFNTSSTAYLWTSYNIVTGEHQDGSEGYYISIYPDKILVRGRDFVNGKWISAAQYCLTGYTNPVGGGSGDSDSVSPGPEQTGIPISGPENKGKGAAVYVICGVICLLALAGGAAAIALSKRKSV